ncbi:phosphatase PAP2 family protein [Clostridium botulinum]|uniref:phosphatase PAP2 family protein n=1 Tax=Clostridium botulinum TaxID=1491 RepID=UPI0004D6B880|nr:phosphatase PAP2 family protein [Clostridium botulinum]KEH97830.1 phosphoesterase PA-phosphatase [Clostridium botulinum D str. 16868]
MTKFRWNEMPYPDEKYGPLGEGVDAGSWPLKFFKRHNGEFYDLKGNKIAFDIKTPVDTMNFRVKQLNKVKRALKELTDQQKESALYWNSENVVILHFNNVYALLKNYKVPAMDSARILSIMGDGVNDAMSLAYYFKYKFQIPRPVQIDPNLNTYLKASYDPSYPVGHGVIGGMSEIVLSYFFPDESEELKNIAIASSMSRVYGGIHYPIDVEQGLRLGRQIGNIIVNTIIDESNSYGNSINNIYKHLRF